MPKKYRTGIRIEPKERKHAREYVLLESPDYHFSSKEIMEGLEKIPPQYDMQIGFAEVMHMTDLKDSVLKGSIKIAVAKAAKKIGDNIQMAQMWTFFPTASLMEVDAGKAVPKKVGVEEFSKTGLAEMTKLRIIEDALDENVKLMFYDSDSSSFHDFMSKYKVKPIHEEGSRDKIRKGYALNRRQMLKLKKKLEKAVKKLGVVKE